MIIALDDDERTLLKQSGGPPNSGDPQGNNATSDSPDEEPLPPYDSRRTPMPYHTIDVPVATNLQVTSSLWRHQSKKRKRRYNRRGLLAVTAVILVVLSTLYLRSLFESWRGHYVSTKSVSLSHLRTYNVSFSLTLVMNVDGEGKT